MTDFNEDNSKLAGDSFKDRILNELEEAKRLKGIEDDGTVKAIVDSLEIDRSEIAPDFNWQEEAAKLKEQEEAAAKTAEEEQKRALEEAEVLRKIQEEEHLKELDSFGEALTNEIPLAEESTASTDTPDMNAVPVVENSPRVEVPNVDLAGFTIPIPINDINSVALDDIDTDVASEFSNKVADFEKRIEERVSKAPENTEVFLTENTSDDSGEANEKIDLTEASRKENKRNKKKKRLVRRFTISIISFFLLILLAGGGFGYYYIKTSLSPLNAKSSKYVTVEIPKGASSKQIGQILKENGIIKDANIFNYYTKFKNYSNLKSGYYNLKASMSIETIIKQLRAGGTAEPTDPSSGKIVIPEGYTIDQIAKAVENNARTKVKTDKTPYSSKKFLELMKDTNFINQMKEKYPQLLANLPSSEQTKYQLEGYLFPATYSYSKGTKLKDIVDKMLATMDTYMAQYYDAISQSKYNVNETLAIASLIEKEGQTDEDRRNIASVFYNRLGANMPLQSNIAVLYASGKLGEKTSLKEDANIDTNIDSPYNDYKNTGIIPGPVDSPSLSAIEAAVHPADTKYLYFVADVDTGNVYYSETYEEHEKNVETYVNKKVSESGSQDSSSNE